MPGKLTNYVLSTPRMYIIRYCMFSENSKGWPLMLQYFQLDFTKLLVMDSTKFLIVSAVAILSNLERLTITYDDCVRDITRERRNMTSHNDQHTKLIVAKIVFRNLEQCIRDRKKSSFKELVEYTKFDQDCHQKLKTLYMVINKLGKYKQKIAIN